MAKRRILRWTVRIVVGLCGLLVVLVAAGAIYQAVATAMDSREHPVPGELVDAGGFEMHLHCTGEGRPTVVLIGGLGDNWTVWGHVQPRVAELTRVCSYDRAGLGFSERGPRPRDAGRQADELSALLTEAGVEGPFVVVGHSLGGLYARVFADRHRDALAGIVLVDSSHEDQMERTREEFGEKDDPMSTMLFLCRMLAPIGGVRLSGLAEREAIADELRPVSTALGNRTGLCRTVADEYAAVEQSFRQTRESGTFGDLPLVVLSSGKRPDPADLPSDMTPEILDRLMEIVEELQLELEALSTRGVRRIAHDAGHYIQLDQPGIVVDAILEVVELDREARAADETVDVPSAEHLTRPPSTPPPSRRSSVGLNIRVNQDLSGGDQNETVIRANPFDPQHLVAGAHDYRTGEIQTGFYTSFDGGQSWVDGLLVEDTYPFNADPAVAFCADGSVVFSMVSLVNWFQPHGLFLYRSTDGGLTWPTKQTVLDRPAGLPFADKPWLACDSTGSAYGNSVYVSWTNMGVHFRGPIKLMASTDFGASWLPEVRVSESSRTGGSSIAIGPDGEVYVAWGETVPGRIGFDRSTDGGVTFGADVFPSDRFLIPDDAVFRRNSFPTMDVDRTTGDHAGNIYIAWSDNRTGDPDLLMVRSTDGGSTWDAPVRVNDDASANGADQWMPALTVDPAGRVIVTFFDRRRSVGGGAYEIWGAISRDGGQTFDTNFLVSEVASDGTLNDFIGDYSGLAATADRLFALWTDLRPGTGESDIYTDRFPNVFAYDEVDGVAFSTPSDLTWETQDARFGTDLQYDVTWGLLSELGADGGFDRASCREAGVDDPPLETDPPPAGVGHYYLVRVTGPGGVGTYGDGTAARPNVRDPLDESLEVCP